MKNTKTIIIAVILVLIVIFSINSEMSGNKRGTGEKSVLIPEGASVKQIASILKDNKVIGSKNLFVLYSKAKSASYYAGVHNFKIKSYKEIYVSLSEPRNGNDVSITVTEGMEYDEIVDLIVKKGLATKEEMDKTAKADNFDYWFLKNLPERKYELEGYLFPDTYEFSYKEGAKSILNKMLKNFDNKFTPEMKKKADDMGKSVDEIITIASIVEREAAAKEEFPVVAGIFYNRLNSVGESNGFLESCATVQYILNERKDVLSVADTKINSPYNTYNNKGLPIGPIASPGMVAINAALNPTKTDYLYFVADGSGKHMFAKDYETHMENMRKAGL